ncbi:hypothetical protein C8R45DRAFT_931093 [Mycena sanguinolenta]|nr:hypothetical protein C8R45DRAFT_931093 [Mycena sanguinolenta]
MDAFWYDISQLWVGTFFYGLIATSRPRNLANSILLVTAISLFTLCTIQAVLNIVLGAAEIDDIGIAYHQINMASDTLYGVNNIIADALVVSLTGPIYRCYVIWDKNRYVVILPILMLIVTTIFALDLKLPGTPFFVLSFSTNVLVTALTAGRIWWFFRRSHILLKGEDQRRLASAMAIIVESGALYSAAVLSYLILGAFPSTVIIQEPIFQMMGIAPTLIIVRAGLGQTVNTTIKGVEDTSNSLPSYNPPTRGSQNNLEKHMPPIPWDVEDGKDY